MIISYTKNDLTSNSFHLFLALKDKHIFFCDNVEFWGLSYLHLFFHILTSGTLNSFNFSQLRHPPWINTWSSKPDWRARTLTERKSLILHQSSLILLEIVIATIGKGSTMMTRLLSYEPRTAGFLEVPCVSFASERVYRRRWTRHSSAGHAPLPLQRPHRSDQLRIGCSPGQLQLLKPVVSTSAFVGSPACVYFVSSDPNATRNLPVQILATLRIRMSGKLRSTRQLLSYMIQAAMTRLFLKFG